MQCEEFLRPGISIVPHPKLDEYHGAWALQHGESLALSVPSKLLEEIRKRCSGLDVGNFQEPENIEALFSGMISKTIGPAFQGYLDLEDFTPCSLEHVRRITAKDRACFQKLQDAVDSTEWEHSALSVDDPTVFGYFLDGQLVAAAKNIMRSDDASDHGIVTHPNYRRRGFGKAVLCASVTHAIEQGHLVIYQTLARNTAAVKVARSLGFTQYGQSLAVRFNE